ncbi:MAG: hypothetical protein NW216_07985 [Hyphomicrobium sp.]|nr:hypothetical protein [Hyphomicrobium sp.]
MISVSETSTSSNDGQTMASLSLTGAAACAKIENAQSCSEAVCFPVGASPMSSIDTVFAPMLVQMTSLKPPSAIDTSSGMKPAGVNARSTNDATMRQASHRPTDPLRNDLRQDII